MASQEPLSGIVLIDCARANANQGVDEAALQCGYGEDTSTFLRELTQACEEAGIRFDTLEDLVPPSTNSIRTGIEIAPETSSEL